MATKLDKNFYKALRKKQQVGSTADIQLNSVPGRSRNRIDISDINDLIPGFYDQLIKYLHTEGKFELQVDFSQNLDEKDEKFLKLIHNRKKLMNILADVDELQQEMGVNTFALGFPTLILKQQLKKGAVVCAPMAIWRLTLKKDKKKIHSLVISRTEDDFVENNNVLISFIRNDSNTTIKVLSDYVLEDGVVSKEELN
ncbi:MAG: DUF4011 domain-containing protein, partial [Bacteroidota bacterium]|nr:DUF4011 domain-containing protein [Bacteroidota bacterium]